MIATPETTIREIVAEDFRAAAVFHKHDIDFCCRGDRSLAEACGDRGLAADAVMGEIAEACAPQDAGTPRFNSWDLGTLVSYIVSNHHGYVRGAIPTLLPHTAKIASVHGERHPELHAIAKEFTAIADEMTSHMLKEERILFPHITAMDAASREGRPVPRAPFGTVDNPIRMMEMEHESAGDTMARIRELSRGYQVPDDGCSTYRVCFQELEAFERDLHAHVHLENNILFPRARVLEDSAR
jgi:regulator of cell morphogenesis and NO signaling